MAKSAKHPMREVANMEIGEQKEKEEDWDDGKRKKGEKIAGMRRGLKRIGKEIKGKWNKVERCKAVAAEERAWEKKIREEVQIVIGKGDERDVVEQKKRRENVMEIIMYTDGSKREERVGVGVCRVNRDGHLEWGRSFGMGRCMEIMDAEMVGIRKAIGQGVVECREKRVSKLVVRVDSQEAMRRVKKREEGPGEMMAHHIRWALEKARQAGIVTTLEWVKAHAGINGNENADKLAKLGCDKPADKESFISLAYLAAKAKSNTIEQWQKEWQTDPRKGKSYQGSPIQRKTVRFENHQREEPVILSRLRTEHIWVNKYAKRIQKSETDLCECGDKVQNVEHVLMECRFSVDARSEAEEKLGMAGSVEKLLYSKEGVKWAVAIWKEFVSIRRQAREEEMIIDKEVEWGYGDLER